MNSLNFRTCHIEDSSAIVQIFTSVFTVSEGESEGALIGKLAHEIFQITDTRDLFNSVAEDTDQIIGSIFFSRLDFLLVIPGLFSPQLLCTVTDKEKASGRL